MRRLEHRTQKPLSRPQFAMRMLHCLVVASGFLFVGLFIGMAGYHWICGFNWVDSFLNASMILGGMGPVGDVPNDAGKIFAGSYALFSGLAFVALAGFLVAPVFHRVLHRFHYEAENGKDL
ncbi:MAG: hypothetical protein JWO82_1081 [Akkermansiaceae bacterium]|nr:hypothetical protein [Akkermansiaceae bacterium]